MRKPIQLVSTYLSGTKGRWRKMSSHQLLCTQQDHMKIYLADAKGRRPFFTTEWCKILINLGFMSQISLHPMGWVINTQNRLHFTIWKIWICQITLWTHTDSCIFLGIHDRCLEGFSFCYCLLGWYNHLQQDSRGTPRPHQASFQKTMGCSLINETQQKWLLHQRDLVPWTHPQQHRHQTTTIKKTQAINNIHPPKTAKQVCAFLGLVRYYRKFINDFTKMAKPLTLLTYHKARFEWTPVHHTAFMTLMEAII